MNTTQVNFSARALVVAVQAAVLAMAAVGSARAADEDDAVRQLTQATNYVEIGAGYISQDSFKFGEYSGMENQGLYGILNFLFRGGDGYDGATATRWSVAASNVGLDSREVKMDYGVQGQFRFDFDYDQLRKNRSDSYQTPYLGAGTSNLTLPSSWIKPVVPQANANNLNLRGLLPASSQTPVLTGGVLVQPTAAQLAQLNTIVATDSPLFQNVDLSTKRERTQAGFSYQFTPEWDFKMSAETESKTGLKAMSTVTSLIREFGAVIPDLVDQKAQQFNLGINYTGDKAFVQAGYYGSLFINHVESMTWADLSDRSRSSTTSTAPSNEFHQFNFTGGYHFSPMTKLVVNASYARNTQNDAFLTDPTLPIGIPVGSLDGLVVTKAFSVKLTSHPLDRLNLNFGFKYDDHDNRTAVNTYIFQDVNEARATAASPFNAALGLAANTLGSNINIYANRPYSKKLQQFDVNAGYAISDGQSLKADYQYQQIDRACDGSWINCADAPRTKENMGRIEWRMEMLENLSASLSYARSERSVNYDENAFLALVPMANFIPTGGATTSVYQYLLATGLTGFGPAAGFPTSPLTGDAAIFSPNNNIVPQSLYGSRNNINELLGLRRFNMADRDLDKLRGRFNWQASEKMSLDAGFDYTKNDYKNSLYGLTQDQRWALNLDGSYSISENASSSVFYSYEEGGTQSAGRSYGSNSNTAFVGIAANTVVSGGCFATVQARNNNNKIDTCQEWTTDAKDKVHTFGVGLNYKGLMDGKLALSGDLVGTRARTHIGVNGGSYVNNPLAAAGQPAVSTAVFFIPAEDFPTVTTNTLELKLNSLWTLNKSSDINAFYWYARMRSSDYVYEGMQFGSLSIVLPTNEQAPSYNVHVVGLTYNYHWK